MWTRIFGSFTVGVVGAAGVIGLVLTMNSGSLSLDDGEETAAVAFAVEPPAPKAAPKKWAPPAHLKPVPASPAAAKPTAAAKPAAAKKPPAAKKAPAKEEVGGAKKRARPAAGAMKA